MFSKSIVGVQDYLQELNTPQRDAVSFMDGASLVIAGAGSGKTRVLTYKITHLLKNGYQPQQILSLTFTNKAAKEMKERIAAIVGSQMTRYLWMGTFHSIFSKILRIEHEAIGFPSTFTIYDSSDSKSLIKTILKDLKIEDKAYRVGMVQSRISLAKNNLMTPQAYAGDSYTIQRDMQSKVPRIKDIYQIYVNRCKRAGAMDFDDLLLYTNVLFRDHPHILEKYRNMFRYILVDEYQDTNLAQYLIVKKLAEVHRQICVVGDDAQSIYSFRGAKVDNILRFPKDFGEAKVFKLEQNYRSTQNIVKAANSLIDKNKDQFKKNTFSSKPEGNKVKVLSAYSDMEEGFQVVNIIAEQHLRDHYDYQDFAILYRTNAQSRIFEEALRKKGMPYKIYGGLSFYDRKEIKDLIGYFRLILNPADDEAFKRIINTPGRKLGKVTLDKVADAALQFNVPLFQVALSPLQYNLGVNAPTAKRLGDFCNLIRSLAMRVENETAFELASNVISISGIMDEYKGDRSPENLSRLENVQELLNAIHEFTETKAEEGESQSLVSFLEDVSLLTDRDTEKDEDKNKVTLMTVHASKGLEFKTVFVVGLEEELFPSGNMGGTARDLEEERRLFYVAITRAEENCILSYAKSRYRYGTPEFNKPSRFLKDIDVSYLELPDDYIMQHGDVKTTFVNKGTTPVTSRFAGSQSAPIASGFKKRSAIKIAPRTPQENFVADPSHMIVKGVNVEHQRFGKGTVLKIEGVANEGKATIHFQNVGQKVLLLKFARLRIV